MQKKQKIMGCVLPRGTKNPSKACPQNSPKRLPLAVFLAQTLAVSQARFCWAYGSPGKAEAR